jgi:hypothetical protein
MQCMTRVRKGRRQGAKSGNTWHCRMKSSARVHTGQSKYLKIQPSATVLLPCTEATGRRTHDHSARMDGSFRGTVRPQLFLWGISPFRDQSLLRIVFCGRPGWGRCLGEAAAAKLTVPANLHQTHSITMHHPSPHYPCGQVS